MPSLTAIFIGVGVVYCWTVGFRVVSTLISTGEAYPVTGWDLLQFSATIVSIIACQEILEDTGYEEEKTVTKVLRAIKRADKKKT